jgi:hypothetical protein
MVSYISSFFKKRKTVEDVVAERHTFELFNIKFVIKKLDVMTYLSGAKALMQIYDTYKNKKENTTLTNEQIKKLERHYKEVFLCSIVEPKLARKEGDKGLPVEHLLTDWGLANGLYEKIIEISYGKKKFQLLNSAAKSW